MGMHIFVVKVRVVLSLVGGGDGSMFPGIRMCLLDGPLFRQTGI
jgi:hypothetical protein